MCCRSADSSQPGHQYLPLLAPQSDPEVELLCGQGVAVLVVLLQGIVAAEVHFCQGVLVLSPVFRRLRLPGAAEESCELLQDLNFCCVESSFLIFLDEFEKNREEVFKWVPALYRFVSYRGYQLIFFSC